LCAISAPAAFAVSVINCNMTLLSLWHLLLPLLQHQVRRQLQLALRQVCRTRCAASHHAEVHGLHCTRKQSGLQRQQLPVHLLEPAEQRQHILLHLRRKRQRLRDLRGVYRTQAVL
jgi:hypothetical protein